MTDELSYEVVVESGILVIPEEYVELSGIRHGNSFEIKIGRKTIRLEDANIDGVEFDDDQYEVRESDGQTILRFLTQTNAWDKKHVIPSVYLEMREYQEGDKFYIRIGRKKIRLFNAKYFNKDGEQIGEGD